mmetsp:Transcript_18050/g.46226  ORF Transcript_18050/g.46226 Transcript_18050/m.46226 type:complete len:251 (+) Transcript_18050:1293-2045(+)
MLPDLRHGHLLPGDWVNRHLHSRPRARRPHIRHVVAADLHRGLCRLVVRDGQPLVRLGRGGRQRHSLDVRLLLLRRLVAPDVRLQPAGGGELLLVLRVRLEGDGLDHHEVVPVDAQQLHALGIVRVLPVHTRLLLDELPLRVLPQPRQQQHGRLRLRVRAHRLQHILRREDALGVGVDERGEEAEEVVLRPQEVELRVVLFALRQPREEPAAVSRDKLRGEHDGVYILVEHARDPGYVVLPLGQRERHHA